uniref:vitamin K-dependent protein S-like n=1 Tax=Styela clava TaxID=7725 RepID=UPI00193A43D9|nr:vitamin K-dependent protein S-like [Styela clava]
MLNVMKLKIVLLLHILLGVNEGISDSPFIDRKEASRFLGRTKRSNSFWEEIKSGNQERECIEEDCSMEEAYEVFDNNFKANQFWKKYLRCNQALPRRYKQQGKIRIARQASRRSERENVKLRACISDEDQCNPFPCVRSNTAECVDTVSSFKCVCKNGFAGRKCESPLNECLSNPCQNSAICEDEIGGFTCFCDSNHEGIFCEIEVNDCRNTVEKQCSAVGGICQQRDAGDAYTCVCNPGYQGELCKHDVDECLNSTSCEQECHNTVGSFTCTCGHGFLIDTTTRTTCKDIDECNDVSHGCISQDFCHNTPGSFYCTCKHGFQLDETYRRYCDDIDECADENGGCPIIEGGCGLNGKTCKTCNNFDGGFNCYCPSGFNSYVEGGDCTDINECESSYHGCQQKCENFPGGYRCLCSEGYMLNFNGKTCSDINECLKDHGCSYRCSNNVGSYYCTCKRGFELDDDQRTCIDTDECQGVTKCDQTCINTDGGYKCGCNPGYRLLGKYKCSEIDECRPRPCGNNGNCIDEVNGYRCECFEGFTGKLCDVGTDPCAGDPCLNSGVCSAFDSGYVCRCAHGYIGPRCQTKHIEMCEIGYRREDGQCIDIDECAETTGLCQQICHNTKGSYTCTCDAGFNMNGLNCEDIDECLNSPCQQVCTNSIGSYDCSCSEGYSLNESDDTCEELFACVGNSPQMLPEKHFLLGTRKIDYISQTFVESSSSFQIGFDFRTFDTDGMLVAVVCSDVEQHYIFLLHADGQLTLAAFVSWPPKIEITKPKNALVLSDGQWHSIILRKRKNRVTVMEGKNKLLDLKFMKNKFGSAGQIYYGGIPGDVTVPTTIRDTDLYFQGCLKGNYTHGFTIAGDSKMPGIHNGCFESIEKGMYFDGSGFLHQSVELQTNLRMRFEFKSLSAQGVIIFAEDALRSRFSVTIAGNQIIASLTTSRNETRSSTFTTSNGELLCDQIWHICDFTITSNMVRLHVDGVAAGQDNISDSKRVQFTGLVDLYIGGRPGATSRSSYTGSLRNIKINRKDLSLDNIVEMNGVRLHSIPAL